MGASIPVLMAVLLSGCATAIPYGPDAYTTDSVRPLKFATGYCAKRHEVVAPIMSAQQGYFVFRCAPADSQVK